MQQDLYKQVEVNTTQQNKFDYNRKTYKWLSTVNPESNSVSLYDIALIKQDIINHFHIRQGEKLSDPRFGTIIWDMLFEPYTEQTIRLITENVKRIIANDPRVRLNNLLVDNYETGISIEIDIVYLQYSIKEKMRMKFDADAGFLSS